MHWQKTALIGVGLLGGSLGLAIKRRKVSARVVGYVRREESVAECHKLGVVDTATTSLSEAVTNADLVIFCTPLSQMREVAGQMLPTLKRGALVTDVGSVKGSVVKALESLVAEAGAHFIGSHPMAGAEKVGPASAKADLFHNAVCVITPTGKSPAKLVQHLDEFWKALGARTLTLTPALHDELVSRSSHLPHVVAAELANYVLSPAHPREQSSLCATGFRDTTRIAGGSPEMWRDIALANRKNLARVLGVFIEDMQEFQRALESEDVKLIEEFFVNAKLRRDAWSASGASASPE